ncbi:MAG: stalk domain-containing protein [Bacillota bacterium]|nr:stalk domain-containing protein [Bacillota bacterium]MDW7676562.1 stalk domain-containing protein [Bacillota bacterium]
MIQLMNIRSNIKQMIPLLTVMMVLGFFTPVWASDISIDVAGVALPPETQAEILDGRVMLQMNEVFRALGAEVQWVEASRTILINRNQQVLSMSLDEGTVQTPEGLMLIEPSPYISEGRTMVPLRFISELLGYQVDWNESARQVTITAQAIDIDIDQEAADQETIDDERTVLPYEEAVNRAIRNSYSLENRLITVRQLEEQRERSEEAFLNTRPISDRGFLQDIQNKQALLGLIQTEINLEISKMQAEIEEERIAFTVKSIFHDIINLENNLVFMEAMLETNELNFQLQQLREQQGLISQVALSATEEELVQFKAQIDSVMRSRTNAYEQLAVMTGISDIHGYRVEALPTAFEVMPEVNLATHVSRKSSVDPYVRLQERQIERAERNLQLFIYTGMEEPYEVRRLTLESEKVNLSALKSRLGESLQNRYQTIRQTENQYQIAQSQLKTLEEQARVLATQLELGMVIEKDVMEIYAAVQNQRNELVKLTLQHQLLLTMFEAPYLMPDYLN